MTRRILVAVALATSVGVLLVLQATRRTPAHEVATRVSAGSVHDAIPVSDFALLDEHGASHRLKYHTDRDLIVILTHQIGCAAVRPLKAEMEGLTRRFPRARLALFMLNANPGEERNSLLADREQLSTAIPTLRDESQVAAGLLGERSRPKQPLFASKDAWLGS